MTVSTFNSLWLVNIYGHLCFDGLPGLSIGTPTAYRQIKSAAVRTRSSESERRLRMNGAARQNHIAASEEIIDTMTILTTMEGVLTDSPLAEVEKRFYVRQIREVLLVRLASFALENEL